MTDQAIELERLEAWIGGLLDRVDPSSRQAAARKIAQALRRANADRIAAQVEPDGSPFTPRKAGGGSRVASLRRRARKRAMFAKLRRFQYLRAEATPDSAEVGFPNSSVARVARVHQLGLRDRVSRESKAEADYPERELLGFGPGDDAMILDMLLAEIQPNR